MRSISSLEPTATSPVTSCASVIVQTEQRGPLTFGHMGARVSHALTYAPQDVTCRRALVAIFWPKIFIHMHGLTGAVPNRLHHKLARFLKKHRQHCRRRFRAVISSKSCNREAFYVVPGQPLLFREVADDRFGKFDRGHKLAPASFVPGS